MGVSGTIEREGDGAHSQRRLELIGRIGTTVHRGWDGAGAPGGASPRPEPGAGSAGPGAASRRRLNAACARRACPDCISTICHVGGTLTAATGASLKELMARLGHSSRRAAMIYQHAKDRDPAIARPLGGLVQQVRVEAPGVWHGCGTAGCLPARRRSLLGFGLLGCLGLGPGLLDRLVVDHDDALPLEQFASLQ